MKNNSKTCPKCNTEKLLDEFGFQKRNKDGRQTYCRSCAYEFMKKSAIKTGAKPWHQEGYATEVEHRNAALEHYAEIFGVPSLLKHKK